LSAKILCVDDDVDYCELLSSYLVSDGFEVDFCHDGQAGFDRLGEAKYDLAIFDMMMPKLTGFELLKKVRAQRNNIPVIMLTAKGDEIDRILGLELGADDYVSKPCSPRELVARIKAILKRSDSNDEQAPIDKPIQVDDLKIDTNLHAVYVEEKLVDLTIAEYQILLTLVKKRGTIVTKANLSEQALSKKLSPYDRSIDMHISNIRAKLNAKTTNPIERVRTVRSVGYVYVSSK
jgi:two-component system, OmpR family, response regulator CpxR